MERTDHAHVDANALALGVLIIIGLIDIFVNVWDGHPFKFVVYFGAYINVYIVAYPLLRRLWRGWAFFLDAGEETSDKPAPGGRRIRVAAEP